MLLGLGMRLGATIRPLDEPGDLGWVVMTHGQVYSEEFGWDTTFEALVARIVADYAAGHDPEREAAWIADVQGQRAGSVFCVARDAQTAQLRLLLVDPAARGLGVGRDLVDRCVKFARAAGYSQLTLWTNDVLVAAARVYLAAGFALVEEEPHYSFGVDLLGQVYELDLHTSTSHQQTAALPRPRDAVVIEQRTAGASFEKSPFSFPPPRGARPDPQPPGRPPPGSTATYRLGPRSLLGATSGN
jgi:GNAT superfamily N-acetyltransferase